VTASCGVAQAQRGEAATELIHRADEALYSSKDGGRNLASWHDGEQTTPVSEQVGTGSMIESDFGNDFDEVCDNLRRRLEEAAGE